MAIFTVISWPSYCNNRKQKIPVLPNAIMHCVHEYYSSSSCTMQQYIQQFLHVLKYYKQFPQCYMQFCLYECTCLHTTACKLIYFRYDMHIFLKLFISLCKLLHDKLSNLPAHRTGTNASIYIKLKSPVSVCLSPFHSCQSAIS